MSEEYPQYQLTYNESVNELVQLRVLDMLLDTYVEMVKLKSQSPGECSHMLAHHTEFIKKQIAIILKGLK